MVEPPSSLRLLLDSLLGRRRGERSRSWCCRRTRSSQSPELVLGESKAWGFQASPAPPRGLLLSLPVSQLCRISKGPHTCLLGNPLELQPFDTLGFSPSHPSTVGVWCPFPLPPRDLKQANSLGFLLAGPGIGQLLDTLVVCPWEPW